MPKYTVHLGRNDRVRLRQEIELEASDPATAMAVASAQADEAKDNEGWYDDNLQHGDIWSIAVYADDSLERKRHGRMLVHTPFRGPPTPDLQKTLGVSNAS